MKNFNYLLLFVFAVGLLACKQEGNVDKGVPTIDITKSYPEKEIILQDIAEVAYIPLETRDETLIDKFCHLCCVSSDTIIIGNGREGSVFIFDGKGKVLSQFNHKGGSDKEYQEIWGLKVDREQQEIIVIDYPYHYRMQVYDMGGDYKRTLALDEKYSFLENDVMDYSSEALLCYDRFDAFKAQMDSSSVNLEPFVLLSKEDGKVLKKLPVKLSQRVNPDVIIPVDKGATVAMATLNSVLSSDNGIILSETSLDTIYNYTKDEKLEPILARSPEVLKMNDNLTMLQVEKISSDYIWARTIKKVGEEKNPFMNTNLVVDRNTHEVFNYKLVNKDAPTWKKVPLIANDRKLLITADKLKEALDEGELNGELAEIAKNISEEDNPVLIKLKFKK